MITEDHLKFFRENGYVKIEGIVPQENCKQVIEAIWSCLGKDPDVPDNWYNPPEGVLNGGGMIEMYHHQSMWNNRQHPDVYDAFSKILGIKQLWVSMDRVNMKPPVRTEHPELDYAFIHWDTDTSKESFPIQKSRGVQGVLYLADTSEKQGGFQCVPGIYRELETYLKKQPADRDPRVPDLTGYEIEAIPGKAGDLVIWDKLLPHGNGHNVADTPRYAQYITMFPARPDNIDARDKRIEKWRHRQGPEGPAFPGDPRGWEQNSFTGAPALTSLGRKLLGLDRWEIEE